MREPVPTTERGTQLSGDAVRVARFGLAPPRRFVLPAILLLVSERPGYGYSLEKDLRDLQFGHVDRPTVYRALAQLEADGLVESWPEAPKAGSARRVYGITPAGATVLRAWMSVIKDERDCLGRVLRRYQETGTVDALLAEVEGGWAGALGSDLSPVSPTSAPPRRPPATVSTVGPGPDATAGAPGAPVGEAEAPVRRFRLVPDRSVVLIEVRSTVGPIRFGAMGLTGTITAAVVDGAVRADPSPEAHVEFAIDRLRSGNGVYDAELARRIDARRYPRAALDLRECTPVGTGSRYRLAGDLTLHGVTRAALGTVALSVTPDDRLVVIGEQVFDIRDFHVPSPTVLMFRIYPDVRVRLHVEAQEGVA
jgi:DNA-binding PadR family transcriptional regulator